MIGARPFLILGAAKSGTTTLAAMLSRHPDICFSDPKEPVFFEAEYDRGVDHYRTKYFKHYQGEPVAGEGRVYNLYLPYVPARIRTTFPEARLIVILRNPVDRAYSHWWHRVTRGNERRSFPAAVEDELSTLQRGQRFPHRETEQRWLENFHPNAVSSRAVDLRQVPYIEMGYYAEQLRRYRALFPPRQLNVLLFEDLRARPEWVAQTLFEFLDLRYSQELAEGDARNEARNRVKGRLAFRVEQISWAMGIARLIPKPTRAAIRRLFPERRAERPPLPAATRRQLTDHYAPFNADLEDLLEADIGHWRIPPEADGS